MINLSPTKEEEKGKPDVMEQVSRKTDGED